MPFTPSHAVVALPFLRTPLVPGAIAVGAMAPDLPLFMRGTPLSYAVTHDPRWVALTALVALGLLLLWRCLLRPTARELTPEPVAVRLPEQWDAPPSAGWRETFAGSWRGGALLAASLVIGVSSHILWDVFTHEGRFGSTVIPVLDADWGPVPGYTWLQHGSSVLGLVAIALWAIVWLCRRRPVAVTRIVPAPVRIAWWVSLPVILATAWAWGLASQGPLTATFTVAHLGYRVLPPACTVWAVLTLLLCLWALSRRRAELRRGADMPGWGSDLPSGPI